MPDPSPYVPDYRHDLFVSYAQVDNQTLGGADGWVHTLVDNLKELLSGQLGRKEWGDIWLDRRLDAGDAITPEAYPSFTATATGAGRAPSAFPYPTRPTRRTGPTIRSSTT